MKDLVILAADKDLEHALKGLLARPEALGTRPVDADIFVEPNMTLPVHCAALISWSTSLRTTATGCSYSTTMGSGREGTTPQDLQTTLNEAFAGSIWGERGRAVVLSPELEAWIWSDSPHVDVVAGWRNRDPKLRPWLIEQKYLRVGEVKPGRPKEAFEAALREAQKPRSASLYQQIAERVSLRRCTDTAFLELKSILSKWFPSERRDLGE